MGLENNAPAAAEVKVIFRLSSKHPGRARRSPWTPARERLRTCDSSGCDWHRRRLANLRPGDVDWDGLVTAIATLEQVVEMSLVRERLLALLATFFARSRSSWRASASTA